MCQLIFRTVPPLDPDDVRPTEVTEILEDGAHPGAKVVMGPLWNSRPFPGWAIVHVPGVRKVDMLELITPELDPDDQNFVGRLRTVEPDLSVADVQELAQERTIVRTRAEVPTRPTNRTAPVRPTRIL